jgi:hypothetical protein
LRAASSWALCPDSTFPQASTYGLRWEPGMAGLTAPLEELPPVGTIGTKTSIRVLGREMRVRVGTRARDASRKGTRSAITMERSALARNAGP